MFDAAQVDKDDLSSASLRRLTAVPRPFLRWAGSKQALLPHIVDVLPPAYARYHEPFLGSGALYLHLRPPEAYLSDFSREVVDTWTALRDHCEEIISFLTPLRPNRQFYYKVRENRSDIAWRRAAEFLYLNKTCWNGLYRVNAQGKFNVPYGLPKTDTIFDPANLRACAALLSTSKSVIRKNDFEVALTDVQARDLVFLDPPYVSKHNHNGFRDWNERLFSWSDQERLARVAKRLADRGAFVIVSNANHEEVARLYKGFGTKEFSRPSTLAANPAKRGTVTEALFFST